MAKKTAKHVKHVPQRTCVGCRQTLAKRSMIRIVRTPEGLRVDPTGKIPGRGAYLHDQRSCWESGLKGALAHALKVELTDEDRKTLQAHMLTLPEEAPLPKEEPLPSEAVLPQEAPLPTETGLPAEGELSQKAQLSEKAQLSKKAEPDQQGSGSRREEIAGSSAPHNPGKHTMTR